MFSSNREFFFSFFFWVLLTYSSVWIMFGDGKMLSALHLFSIQHFYQYLTHWEREGLSKRQVNNCQGALGMGLTGVHSVTACDPLYKIQLRYRTPTQTSVWDRRQRRNMFKAKLGRNAVQLLTGQCLLLLITYSQHRNEKITLTCLCWPTIYCQAIRMSNNAPYLCLRCFWSGTLEAKHHHFFFFF